MAVAKRPKWYISTIGGALGDESFEPGDRIPVPPEKEKLWLDLGLIKPIEVRNQLLSKVEADQILEED